MTENVQVANAPYNPTPEEIKTKKYERKLTLFKERLEAQLEMKQAELEAKDKRISFMEASKQFEEHVLREELEEVSKAKQEFYTRVKEQQRRIKDLEVYRENIVSEVEQGRTQIQELTAELSETISIEEYEKIKDSYRQSRASNNMNNKVIVRKDKDLEEANRLIEKLKMDVEVVSRLRDTAHEAIGNMERDFKEINSNKEAHINKLLEELQQVKNQLATTEEAMVYRGETIKDLQNLLTSNGIDWHNLMGPPKNMKEVRDRGEIVKKAKRKNQ